jgi:hypothetical protein
MRWLAKLNERGMLRPSFNLGGHVADDHLQLLVDAADKHLAAILRAPDQVVLRRVHRLVVEW